MGDLLDLKAYRASFRTFGTEAVPRCFPGVLGNEPLEVELCRFVLFMRCSGTSICCRELCPAIGQAHVDNANRFQARLGRFDAKEARGLAALNASPELLLGGQQKVPRSELRARS
jgi:hypothetical protein